MSTQTNIVYLHTNLLTGKSYVGITSKTMQARWRGHVRNARCGSANAELGRAIRKYGENCWLHSLLEVCSTRHSANEAEKRWIRELETQRTGYNLTSGGDNDYIVSDAARAKVSASKLGHTVTASTRAKISAAKTGRKRTPEEQAARPKCRGWKLSQETIERRRAAMLGKKLGPRGPMSEATKKKLREKAVLRRPSAEARQRMSEAGKRRAPPSKETVERIRAALIGKRHSEEAKALMSQKAKARVWTEAMKAQAAKNLQKAHDKQRKVVP